MRIWLDAGHGGKYPGAIGATEVPEKDIALSVVLQMGGHLQSLDHVVEYTRRTDIALAPVLADDLQLRCDRANEWGANVFVSIHCNSFSSPYAHGFEVWTNPDFDPADALASIMFYRFRQAHPEMRGRADLSDGDPDKESKFRVLVGTNSPAVLFELAFISNPEDESRLLTPVWQVKSSDALSGAIKEWNPNE
jgi:N-acetylmuramoyl-L-alanine amidase